MFYSKDAWDDAKWAVVFKDFVGNGLLVKSRETKIGKNMTKKIFIFTTLIVFFGVANVNSEELIVKDCDGTLKAAQDVENNSLSTIRLSVADKDGNFLDGVKVALTSQSFGEKISQANNGVATFREIQAGTWTMCLPESTGGISRVSIVAPQANAEITNTSLVGPTILGVGAVTGAVLGLTAGSSGGSDDSSESTLLVGNGSGSFDDTVSDNSSRPRPSKPAQAKPRPFAGEDCNTDEPSAPVSAFD